MREGNDPFEKFTLESSDEENEDYESPYAERFRKRRKAEARKKLLSDRKKESDPEAEGDDESYESGKTEMFSETERKKTLSEERAEEIFGDTENDTEEEKTSISEKRKKLAKLARLRRQKEKNYEEYFSQEQEDEDNYFDETYGNAVRSTRDKKEPASEDVILYYGIPEDMADKEESKEKLSSYITEDLRTLGGKHKGSKEGSVFSESAERNEESDGIRSSRVHLRDMEETLNPYVSEKESFSEDTLTFLDTESTPDKKDKNSRTLSRIRRNVLLKEDKNNSHSVFERGHSVNEDSANKESEQDCTVHEESVFNEPVSWQEREGEYSKKEKVSPEDQQGRREGGFETSSGFSEAADNSSDEKHESFRTEVQDSEKQESFRTESAKEEKFVSSKWHEDEEDNESTEHGSLRKEALKRKKAESFSSDASENRSSGRHSKNSGISADKDMGTFDGPEKIPLNESSEFGGMRNKNPAEWNNEIPLNESSELHGMKNKNVTERDCRNPYELLTESGREDENIPYSSFSENSKIPSGNKPQFHGESNTDPAETEKFITSEWHSDGESRSKSDTSGSFKEAVNSAENQSGIAESLKDSEDETSGVRRKRKALRALADAQGKKSFAENKGKTPEKAPESDNKSAGFIFRENRGEDFTGSHVNDGNAAYFSPDYEPKTKKNTSERRPEKSNAAESDSPDISSEGFYTSKITSERNENFNTTHSFFSEKERDAFTDTYDAVNEMPYKRKRKRGIFLMDKKRKKKLPCREEAESTDRSVSVSNHNSGMHTEKSGISEAVNKKGIKEELRGKGSAYSRKKPFSYESELSQQTKQSSLKERLKACLYNSKAKESPDRKSDEKFHTSGAGEAFSERSNDSESFRKSPERKVFDEGHRNLRNLLRRPEKRINESEFYNGEAYMTDSISDELERHKASDSFETYTVSSDYENVKDRKIINSIFYKEKSDFRKNTEEESLSKKDLRDKSAKKSKREAGRRQRIEKQYAAFRKAEDINIKARNAALEFKRLTEKSAGFDDGDSQDDASKEVFDNSAYIAKVMTQQAIKAALDKDTQYSSVSEISKSVTAEEKAKENEKTAAQIHKEQEKRRRAAAYKSAKNAEKGASAAGKAAAQGAKEAGTAAAATTATASHGWIVALIMAAVALIMMICVSCSVIVTAVGGGLVSSTYMADDKDIFEATTYYCEKEAEMKAKINKEIKKAESSILYDDVRYSVDPFEHDPRVIISYLCAQYPGWDFNSSIMEYGESFIKHVFDHDHPGLGVKPILDDLFEAQYEYQETEYIEYYYPSKRSLFPKLIKVKEFSLVNKGLDEILLNELKDEETKEYYDTLNEYRGNRAWFGKVVDYKYDDFILNLCGDHVDGTIMTSRLINKGLSNGGGLSLAPEGSYVDSGDLTYNDDGSVSANGTVINLPPGKGEYFTFEGWQKITAQDTLQLQLKEQTGMHFDSEGFGVVGNRYAVAVTSKYGSVGDYIDVYQSDGTIFPCIIGDIKAATDPGNDGWGHNDGKVVVEFIVDKTTWYYPMHDNPGTAAFHPEWGGKNITKIVNLGSYFSGDAAPDAGYMPDGMHEMGYTQTNNLAATIDDDHWGIDIAGAQDTEVYACFNGTVKNRGEHFVEITDEDGIYMVRYDSVKSAELSSGQTIEQGTVLGTMDDNEHLGIPHLHLELKNLDDDQFYDSFFYFDYGEGEAPEVNMFSGGGYSATGSFVPGDSELGNRVVQKALTRLGMPYVYGGAHSEAAIHNPNQSVFDCSGLVCWAYCQAGASVGVKDTKGLSKLGRQLSLSDMQAGDIILWSSNGAYSGIHHVAIYIGGGKVIEAPKPGDVVCISNVYDKNLIYTIRRLYE